MGERREHEAIPYSGIPTFLKAPFISEPTASDGQVAVLGIPFDEGVTNRPGARYGPRAMREVSQFYAYRTGDEPYYDGEAKSELLAGIRFVDVGDVGLPTMAPVERTHPRVAARVAALLEAGLFPLVLGGDHSITYPVLQGFADRRPHLVQLDTHMDYWEEEGGVATTHASPVIRSHEADLIAGVTQYGIRGLHTEADNIELARSRGVTICWAEELKTTPVGELVAHIGPGQPVYVTLDIDVLDPSIAPGTGTPEPGGLSYYEAKALLRAVAQRGRLIGMDVVEVDPLYDPAQLTAIHAVRLALDTLGAAFAARPGGD